MSVLAPESVSFSSGRERKQPLSTFISIRVGDRTISFKPPKHEVSLEFKRVLDGGSTFTLNLLDPEWEELEALFADNFNNVILRYGYVNGAQSKPYQATLADYSIDFTPAGTILHIQGTTKGTITNLTPITLDTTTKNPTEAAKKICKSVGWKVEDQNFHPSLDVELDMSESISLIEEHPATYIINHLAPIAIRSSDGESGYRFHLDETEDPPVAYFRPMDLVGDTTKTYVYMKGINSVVLDLQINVEGVFGGSGFHAISTQLEASFIDPVTKEFKSLSETVNSVRKNVTGTHTHTASTQSKTLVDASANSRSQMNAILNYRLKGTQALPYTATLTIIGDPDFEIGGTIRLIIITNKGNLHHSSGIYGINNITDNIDSGIMRTSLDLVKWEDLDSGVELVNYHHLIK